jgi:hypothetical protein
MRKLHDCVDAELATAPDSPAHVEIRFLYNGELAYARRHVSRTDALEEARAKRAQLERDGWMPHW